MGYFKNEIIANQVELGDRIPDPKPATSLGATRLRATFTMSVVAVIIAFAG